MKLEFIHSRKGVLSKCRMCGMETGLQVGEIIPERSSLPVLSLFKCERCGSLVFGGENPVLGYEDEDFTKEFWKFYAEAGAGIREMLEPLHMLGERFCGNLLDVGCGFGFVVDYVNSTGIGEAIGLESAEYGRIGAIKLGAPIYSKFYRDCAELANKRFDLVYSSEVLEHVPDPEAFIREISLALAEGGILVLTTPSSNGFNPDRDEVDVLSLLSPHFHFMIASPAALKSLLIKCGFSHVKVQDEGTRLFAWASHSPLPSIVPTTFDKSYHTYLRRLSQNKDDSVRVGALHRLFKEAVTSQQFTEAETLLERLADFSNGYSELVINDITSQTDDCRLESYWYGSILTYWALMKEKRGDNDYLNQLKILTAATASLEKCLKLHEHAPCVQEWAYLAPVARRLKRLVCFRIINNDLENAPLTKRGEYRDGLILIRQFTGLLAKVIGDIHKRALWKGICTRVIGDIDWWMKNWKKRFFNS